MKHIKNTFLHATVALAVFMLTAICNSILIELIGKPIRFGRLYVATFFAFTIVFELYQKTKSRRVHYWRDKWLDSILDVVAANVVYALLMWSTSAW